MRSHSLFRSLLILGRVSNLPTVWTNIFVGWFVTGGVWTGELGWLIAGISLVYVAGMTLNDVFDIEWDSEHAPERPVPSGNLSFHKALIIGLLEMVGGVTLLLGKTSFRLELLAVLIAAILFYNWIHKRWTGSVVVMGICRAMVYLGAASAVAGSSVGIEIPVSVIVVAVATIIYISGLTLAARSERSSEKSGRGMNRLVRLMLMLPVLFPLLAAREIPETPADLFRHTSVVIGVVGIWAWLAIVRSALHEKIAKGVAFAIAGIALYDAAIVAFANWPAAVFCVFAFLLTLIAQRYIPAT